MWDAEVLVQHLAVCDSFFCFCVSCLLNNQQHLRTDTLHIAAEGSGIQPAESEHFYFIVLLTKEGS